MAITNLFVTIKFITNFRNIHHIKSSLRYAFERKRRVSYPISELFNISHISTDTPSVPNKFKFIST